MRDKNLVRNNKKVKQKPINNEVKNYTIQLMEFTKHKNKND